jgi:hypothetical protein
MAVVAAAWWPGAWAMAPDAALAPRRPVPGAAAAAVPAGMTPAAAPAVRVGTQARQRAAAGRPASRPDARLRAVPRRAGAAAAAGGQPDPRRELLVPEHVVAASAHGDMSLRRLPHRLRALPARRACHADADVRVVPRRRHGPLAARLALHGGRAGRTCVQCHGSHDIRTVEELRSPKPALRGPTRRASAATRPRASSAHSPHADAVLCAACHAPHDVRPVHDPESWMAPARQRADLRRLPRQHRGGRGAARHPRRRGAAPRAPRRPRARGRVVVCTSCHIGHEMIAIDDPRFASCPWSAVPACHEHARARSSARTTARRRRSAHASSATCADCHGAHDILPDAWPRRAWHRRTWSRRAGRATSTRGPRS